MPSNSGIVFVQGGVHHHEWGLVHGDVVDVSVHTLVVVCHRIRRWDSLSGCGNHLGRGTTHRVR
jgi:hypothetical protein